MTVALTPSQENYVEWIYRLGLRGPVKACSLARKLGVRLPSVSRAVVGLRDLGLVRHDAYGTIDLTEAGELVGASIVRRDTCLTSLLVDVLGMDPTDADPAVHQMEHVLTDEVLQRLEVLVAFCQESPSWLKRLHLRVERRSSSAETPQVPRVGATNVHAGFAREKSREPRPETTAPSSLVGASRRER